MSWPFGRFGVRSVLQLQLHLTEPVSFFIVFPDVSVSLFAFVSVGEAESKWRLHCRAGRDYKYRKGEWGVEWPLLQLKSGVLHPV